MNKGLSEVREDDVIKLFRSIPFRGSLRQAGGFTKQTGHESGFRVVRDLYSGTCYFSKVVKGTTVGFGNHEDEIDNFEFKGQNVPFKRCHAFLDLHFHPEITKYPVPSYDDLLDSEADIENYKTHERIEVCPIMAISHILNDDTVISLLYQKKFSGEIRQLQTLRELDSDLDKIAITNPSKVVDYLKSSGLFYADILILEKRRHYIPDKEDYPRLKLFANTPRRRESSCNNVDHPLDVGLYLE